MPALPDPLPEGLEAHNGEATLQLLPQHPAKPEQPPALTRRHGHSLGQLAVENLILDPQVLDLPDQIALDGLAQQLK